MKIIICGAGEVGSHATEVLDQRGHSITVIDTNNHKLRSIEEIADVRTLHGNCSHVDILEQAGVSKADMVVAATEMDEVNLLTASVAKRLGAGKTIARVHDYAYLGERGVDYRIHLGIDELICPEFTTVSAISQTLRNPAAMAVESFARGQIELEQFPVTDDAPAIGRPLSDVPLPVGSRLVAIERNGEVIIPDGATVAQPGDVVFLVSNSGIFEQARKLFREKQPGRRKVVIMGGEQITVWLCNALHDRTHSIRVFERDHARAEELAAELDWVTVINADPTDENTFLEERLAEADDFVALLDDDEDNIIAAVFAKMRGVRKVVSIVQRSNYLDLLFDIGVDRAFSPRIEAARQIENVLDSSPIRRITSVARGVLDIYRIEVGDQSHVLGQRLRSIKLTPNWSVIAVQRDQTTMVPNADDTIEPGDIVMIIGRKDQEKQLRELFDVS